MEELIAHYGDIKINALFIQLINLRKISSIIDYLQQFQKNVS